MSYTPIGSALSFSVRLWRIVASALSLLALACLTTRAAEPAATGTLTGSITSAGTRNALQGAAVSLPALNRTELTDNSGTYTFSGVPAGTQEVVVNYDGFTETRERVAVNTGQTTRLNSTLKSSETISMAAYTVESVKEGQALALTQQRNAPNIKNVTSFDEWGVLPTQNIAELLTRLPGIAVAQQDEDGLSMSVSIGGQPGGNAGYTRMNIDGMASTGVGGDGRTATMHSFSASMYESVEIIAGQTPDKRADGLGGQLNLVTASPLGMAERRRFDFTASTRYFPSFSKRNDMLSDHALRPDLSFSYRGVYDVGGGTRNLGVMINTGYQEVVNQHDFDVLLWQNTTNTVGWLQDYQRTSGLNDRFIKAFSARVDYRLSPVTKVSLRFLYNEGVEPFFQYTHVNPFGSANLTVYDATTNPNGSIMPGFTADRTEIRPTATTVAGTAVGAARLRLNMWKVSFESQNPTGTLVFDHNWGRLKIDHAYRWSNTEWTSGAGRNKEQGEVQMRTKDPLGFILDYTNPDGQVFTQTNAAAVNLYNPASYTPFVVTARNLTTQPTDQTSTVFIKRNNVTHTNEVSALVNAQYLLPTALPITLKTGLDTVNRRVNTFVPNARRWYGVVGSVLPTTGLVPLTEFEIQNTGGQRLPVVDPAAISTTLGNTALWTEDLNFSVIERLRTTRIVEEGVDAAYLQASTRFGRLSILGGVRGEWVSTEAFNYVAASAAQRTPIALEPDPVKRALLDYTPASRDGKYHKLFPSVHLAYDLTAKIKLRSSWSNSYGRPRLQDLVAIPTAVDPSGSSTGAVTVGNPDLKPALANNYDFRFDYAFSRAGFFSARYFYKDIKDYIGNSIRSGFVIPDGPDNGFGGEFVGYELIRPLNLGSTTSKGIELDFRQRLTFLPGAFKGLSVRANYTNVHTTAVFNGISYGRGQVVGSAGQWYVPRTYNLGLTYVRGKFGASWDYNYTSQFPVAFSQTTLQTNIYRLSRTLMGAGVTYQLRPEATLFLNISNIEETGLEEYRYITTRHYRAFNIPRSLKLGVTGRF